MEYVNRRLMKGVKEQMKVNRMEDKRRMMENQKLSSDDLRPMGDKVLAGDMSPYLLPPITEGNLEPGSPDRDVMSAMSAMSLAHFKQRPSTDSMSSQVYYMWHIKHTIYGL